MRSPKITIYYGSTPWFRKRIKNTNHTKLLKEISDRDSRTRQFTVNDGTLESTPEAPTKIQHAIMECNDYASLVEHAITNFAGLIQEFGIQHLHLHNPPLVIHEQMESSFRGVKTCQQQYSTISADILKHFNNDYDKSIIGQDEAKQRLLAALYPLTKQQTNKPVVLMFYGPSGVGKTETANYISSLLNEPLLRKQFSMFQNDRFASYVFGGRHNEDSFAKDLLKRESNVILIDEFDKAAPVFYSAFYQFFDDGIFEDKNYKVKLDSPLIICTSNYNSENEIKTSLGDALYSRFDQLIRFSALSPQNMQTVTKILIDKQIASLSDKEKQLIDVNLAKERLCKFALKIDNIRQMRKTINEYCNASLVKSLLNSEFQDLDN